MRNFHYEQNTSHAKTIIWYFFVCDVPLEPSLHRYVFDAFEGRIALSAIRDIIVWYIIDVLMPQSHGMWLELVNTNRASKIGSCQIPPQFSAPYFLIVLWVSCAKAEHPSEYEIVGLKRYMYVSCAKAEHLHILSHRMRIGGPGYDSQPVLS